MVSMRMLVCIPLAPSAWVMYKIISNDMDTDGNAPSSSVGAQLLLFYALGVLGYLGTYRLVPNIKYYMLKRGICGKDLGKKGTERENEDMYVCTWDENCR